MRRSFAGLAIVCAALRAGVDGTLAGHVVDPAGFGVAGAEVRVANGALHAITDANGAFRIRGVPAGVAPVTVRRIGFRPATREVTVGDGATADVSIVLELLPVQLQQVTVTERREILDPRLAGFRDRMQKRSGHFFTLERIQSLAPTQFTDLLRGVPGVRIGPIRGTGILRGVRFRGSACWPIVFIDGFAVAASEFDLDTVDPATVEAVEVYSDAASAPTELMGPRGGDRCGVIAIWSRTFRPRNRPQATIARAELQSLLDAASIYLADDVDSVARVLPETFSPTYPDSLWRRAVDGYARVEFVVDQAGAMEWEYFSVVSASNPAFGESVRAALEKASFVPAVKGRRRVRQVVQLPVVFERPKRSPDAG